MSHEPLQRRYRRFFRADPARDVDEELAFHIEMRVAELVRAGVPEHEAREQTMERFGSFGEVRDECHELGRERARMQRRSDRLDALRQDLRYAVRTLVANKTFALAVVLTMALGLGANTAVFSVAYGVLLRPLPYRDAGQLVRLWTKNASRGLEFFSVSPADYRDWRAGTRDAFTAMAAFERQREAVLVRQGAGAVPEAVEAAAVTPDVFPLLGAPALLGRALVDDDARAGAPAVAVVSHDLWQSRFGGDPALVGARVALDGVPVTVVGVMPPRFWIPGTPAQVWTPLSLAGTDQKMLDHANRYLRVLGRLAPGVTREAALARLDVVAARLARDHPATNGPWTVNAMAVPEMLVGKEFRSAVLILLGVVGFVLLIACANAANLQLARAASREREIALRSALGASRGRIARQLLTESVLLGTAAGALGLLLAWGGVALLRAIGEATVPRLDDVRIDGPVLAFTALAALGSGVLFGLLPALRASRPDAGEVLKQGPRGSGAGLVGQGVRSALVVAEVSLSLVLLVGAGLLMRSFVRLQAVTIGFEPAGLAVVPLRLPEASYPEPERAARLHAALLERVRAVPGVTSAAAVTSAPFAGPNAGLVFARADRPAGPREQAPDADYRVVTAGYFATMGTRVLRGRDIAPLDRAGAPPVVLVSETLARRTWPNEDPLGKAIRIDDPAAGPLYTVVGVVEDARYQSLETPEPRPMMFFSAHARPQRALTIVARGADVGALTAGVREAMAALDPALPPPAPRAMEELVGAALATPRFAMALFGIFAAVALLLSAVGIYGVMAYLVRQRMHEMGIRLALGAPARTLVGAVVGRALRLTIAGVVVGLAGSWWLTRVLSALLFGVSATDAGTFAAVALLLTAVAGVAALVPARRATRADPVVVLRGE